LVTFPPGEPFRIACLKSVLADFADPARLVAAGEPIAVNGHAAARCVDWDGDGPPDLLVGVNWGTVTAFRNLGTATEPRLGGGQQRKWAASGDSLSLRKLQGDDTTPDLADLDGDGVLDLVSGGKQGRVVVLPGVGSAARIAAVKPPSVASGFLPQVSIGMARQLHTAIPALLLRFPRPPRQHRERLVPAPPAYGRHASPLREQRGPRPCG